MNAPMGEPGIESSRYDRAALRLGAVHIGYGAFHRAHQAVFLDRYMEETGDLSWGVAAVNLRASEATAFAQAGAGEGYVLKTTTPAGERRLARIRPHIAFADWSADPAAAEGLLARPEVTMATITVTESGYCLDDAGRLNPDDPVIAAERAGGPRTSLYAYLAGGLRRRMASRGPITLLCCDNIRGNGRMLRANFAAYLEMTGQGALADWVAGHVRFPNSMVDRITPRATAALAAEVEAAAPGEGAQAIHAEAFIQWVLEADFAGPMPDLTRAGVEVVADVDPYEEAKIRILNGGHTGLAYLGALAGHATFDQAMRDPALRAHFDAWERDEVLPGLTLDLPFDKYAYLDEIAARFENAAIADSLERICMDGYSKMPIYIRPTLEARLAQGAVPERGFDCVASWRVFARRATAGAPPVPYHDPYWPALEPLLADGAEEAFARARPLWADLPDRFPQFVPGLIAAVKRMEASWPA